MRNKFVLCCSWWSWKKIRGVIHSWSSDMTTQTSVAQVVFYDKHLWHQIIFISLSRTNFYVEAKFSFCICCSPTFQVSSNYSIGENFYIVQTIFSIFSVFLWDTSFSLKSLISLCIVLFRQHNYFSQHFQFVVRFHWRKIGKATEN